MAVKLNKLNYAVGSPGMIASASYKHTRQQVQDDKWVNKTASTNFIFGTAAFVDPATGNLCLSDAASAVFTGVFQDPVRFMDRNWYAPKESVIVCTMGDIWASVDPAATLKFMDKVYVIKVAGATFNFFTNVAGASNILIPNARFTTENVNGIATLALGAWGTPMA